MLVNYLNFITCEEMTLLLLSRLY